jgi:3-deoxy-D-manno-octulosonate 8-phosphate phosphatase (KDO 8-P phosphatase)
MNKKKIKLFIFDVDGVLTDGRTFWNGEAGWCRFFHLHDGHGIERLHKAGYKVAVITRSPFQDIRKRVEMLKIKHAYFDCSDKLVAYEDLLKKLGLKDENALFMGDDLFDLPVLERVGFSATVADAQPAVRKKVDYVTKKSGGQGAVREVIELFLK